ncbi:hypothetical protein C8R44DRAFT_823508 [Mycena epipterygia]|nr:hypothetical protein C8R44DRAFT_823508 [Mycena epipterygia]
MMIIPTDPFPADLTTVDATPPRALKPASSTPRLPLHPVLQPPLSKNMVLKLSSKSE